MHKEFDIRKRTLIYSVEVISFFKKEKKYDFIEQIVVRQLIRAVTSIGANVQEAKGAHSPKDYHNFFCIALKSANEAIYWFSIIAQTGSSNLGKILEFKMEADEISKIIASCIIKMRK